MKLRKINLTVTQRIHIQSEYAVANPGNWKLSENRRTLHEKLVWKKETKDVPVKETQIIGLISYIILTS